MLWRRDLPRQRRCVEISGERRRRRVKRRHDAKRGKGRTLLGRKLLHEGGRVELFRRRQQRRRRREVCERQLVEERQERPFDGRRRLQLGSNFGGLEEEGGGDQVEDEGGEGELEAVDSGPLPGHLAKPGPSKQNRK